MPGDVLAGSLRVPFPIASAAAFGSVFDSEFDEAVMEYPPISGNARSISDPLNISL